MRFLPLSLLFVLAAAPKLTAAETPDTTFFEQKIRPVLVRECYSCHSADAKKLRGGLLLDTREGVLKGGDTGPALVPGKPADSLLLKALRYDELNMPPKGKLPDEVVANFETWIKSGAPDPRDGKAAAKRVIDIEAGRKFWAYQPPRRQPPPLVKDGRWSANGIDRFLLAALEAKGLKPVGDADRVTLVRRVYFDLIGLPPTPEQVDAFANDKEPGAYERLVDELLARPEFGERWGRHWLDVARFGESMTLRGFVFKEAWRYRDYVIDSFNQDEPFDRFVQEQIAGDLMAANSPAERRRQLVATTFLVLGNHNLEEQDKKQLQMDVVDEQLDTIGKAFLAQTLGCARCHDHKFDPIPTKDYYALAGILRSTRTLEHSNVSKWLELPLPADPAEEAVLQEKEAALAALRDKIKVLKDEAAKAGKGPARTGAVAIADLPGIVVDDADAKKVGDWKASHDAKTYVGKGFIHDGNAGKGEKTLTFQPELPAGGKYEVRLAYPAGKDRANNVNVTIFSADGEKTVHIDQQKAPPIEGLFISLGQYHFEKSNQGFVIVDTTGTKGEVAVDAVVFIPVEKLGGDKEKPNADMIKALEADLKKMEETGPKRAMTMSVVEEKEVGDTQVHIRGNVHSLGEKAPRGFLRVAECGKVPAIPAKQSGRRELAEWLGSTENPLTARVMVNRTWHWLFGAGLVLAPDNFGTTGDPPSHPELLDALTVQFTEDGWSVKRLVRRIVLSRAYRLSSVGTPEALAADPDNRLLSHMNRRRLDAECIRDAMLCASAQLRTERGGPGFPANLTADYGYRGTDLRRSVYLPVFRNALPEPFEAFDFADSSVTTGRRNVSTIPSQALFLMNHPFVLDQAKQTARRLIEDEEIDDHARTVRAYRIILGRSPTETELKITSKFFAADKPHRDRAWVQLCQSLFASLDFRFVN
jgi:hypothetical protein